MLPYGAQKYAPWIGLLAAIGIVYAALACLAQKDLKRLIAFSSVGHMGFVMLGIATLTDDRHPGGDLRHGGARRDHRACCSSASARSTTATTRGRSRRSAAAWRSRCRSSAGVFAFVSIASLGPARDSPGSGARSWRCSRRSARTRARALSTGAVPRVHGRWRHRHDPHRRLLPVDAAAGEHGHAARTSGRSTALRDVLDGGVGRVDAAAGR